MTRMHSLRTPGLSEEFVERMQERNVASRVGSTVAAMESSSFAACEYVSRSESLFRRPFTLVLRA